MFLELRKKKQQQQINMWFLKTNLQKEYNKNECKQTHVDDFMYHRKRQRNVCVELNLIDLIKIKLISLTQAHID